MRKTHGFTLTELIVTLLVLAVLTAILLPAGLGFLDRHNKDQCLMQRKAALVSWEAKNLMQPGTTLSEIIDGLSEKEQCPGGGSYSAVGDGIACSLHGGDAAAVRPPEEE